MASLREEHTKRAIFGQKFRNIELSSEELLKEKSRRCGITRLFYEFRDLVDSSYESDIGAGLKEFRQEEKFSLAVLYRE